MSDSDTTDAAPAVQAQGGTGNYIPLGEGDGNAITESDGHGTPLTPQSSLEDSDDDSEQSTDFSPRDVSQITLRPLPPRKEVCRLVRGPSPQNRVYATCATSSVKSRSTAPKGPVALSPTDTTSQSTEAPSLSTKATAAMPDINTISKLSTTDHQKMHHLFEHALVYLSQSPLSTQNRRKGIDTLFDLLNQIKLVQHPLLHAMTHTAIAVNTQFDDRDNCKYKVEHIEKAKEIVLSMLRDSHGYGPMSGYGKEEGACQGCLYARLQAEAGKGAGEEDASECNSLARLGGVLERESRKVEAFNWGEMDHLLV